MSELAVSQLYNANAAHLLGQGLKASPELPSRPRVFVVDEDASVRESLELLTSSQGWQPETFASAHEFLSHPRALVPNCLLLDVCLSDIHGLDLQRRVAIERPEMPIIFVAERVDVPTTVQAMKAGAVGVFPKPFQENLVVIAIQEAIERSRCVMDHEAELQALRECYASLTTRENQVMTLVVAGLLNKQVGSELGISEITVKAHRGQAMKKMKAESLAHLVKMVEKLRLTSSRETNAVTRAIAPC
jgi:FixJ family two-component response regulator